jgi:hypothetical protein
VSNRPRHRTQPGRKPDLSALRHLGCTCTPTYVKLPPAAWPEGMTDGLLVTHPAGCPFGDEMHQRNLLGRTPLVVYTGNPRKPRQHRGGRR